MRHETCVFPGVLHTVILVLNAKYHRRLPTENVNKITGLIYRYKRCTSTLYIYTLFIQAQFVQVKMAYVKSSSKCVHDTCMFWTT